MHRSHRYSFGQTQSMGPDLKGRQDRLTVLAGSWCTLPPHHRRCIVPQDTASPSRSPRWDHSSSQEPPRSGPCMPSTQWCWRMCPMHRAHTLWHLHQLRRTDPWGTACSRPCQLLGHANHGHTGHTRWRSLPQQLCLADTALHCLLPSQCRSRIQGWSCTACTHPEMWPPNRWTMCQQDSLRSV